MTAMTLYPAIDVLEGHCMRLLRGEGGETRIEDEDPVAVATRWHDAGAEWLHMVDLDGVRDGRPRNLDAVRAIVAATDLSVQFAGGMGKEDDVAAAFEAGASRALLSMTTAQDASVLGRCLERWGERVAVPVDARGEQELVAGWLELVPDAEPALALARKLLQSGVQTLVLTNISHQRMPDDTSASSLAELRAALQGKTLIAAGDIATLDDIRWLRGIGFDGVVLGRALYEGKLDLAEALEAARSPLAEPAPAHAEPAARADQEHQAEDASQG
jgi:phosphoribosylformimino-5-aminoimidazole carboxamide ribotide isomerase